VNPSRFAAFCALSMHDPQQASEELSRCVKDHGMVGAMLNDFQNGEDGKPIYYDQPEYDVFWKTVEELDVVVYIHPRFPHPAVIENVFGGRRALLGACWLVFALSLLTRQEFRLWCWNTCARHLHEWSLRSIPQCQTSVVPNSVPSDDAGSAILESISLRIWFDVIHGSRRMAP